MRLQGWQGWKAVAGCPLQLWRTAGAAAAAAGTSSSSAAARCPVPFAASHPATAFHPPPSPMLQVQLKDKWRSLQADRTPGRRRRAGGQAQHPQLPWTEAEERGLVRPVAQQGTSNWQVGRQHLRALFGGDGWARWAAAGHQELAGTRAGVQTLCAFGLQHRLPPPHSLSRQPACGLPLVCEAARR